MSSVTCDICPRFCSLKHNESGVCKVIKNESGVLRNVFKGVCSSISVEPIEKRPFFHFLPGSQFLSVGFYGCPLNCQFCQNYLVSQNVGSGTYYSPNDLIELALRKNVRGIVFTYNEPAIFYDYIEEVSDVVRGRKLDLKIVLKSSGFINDHIADRLCKCIDAINIDIKGGHSDYNDICGGVSWSSIANVIEFIAQTNVHLELSYLVLPTRIDDHQFHVSLRDWLVRLGKDVPLHMLYLYPFHQLSDISYDANELLPWHSLFSEMLNYVYISNRYDSDLIRYRNTYCATCQSTVIDRTGSPISVKPCCGNHISGIFE